MGNKLYVGNLNYRTSDEELSQAFAAFGTVASTRIITDRESGRSKGFGFVEMSSPEEAQASIEGLNGKELNGRELRVSEAREK